jgi:peptidoglycan hydrolase-like protein with peptidoglycan-binding domain
MSNVSYGVDIASYQDGLDLAKVKGEGFAFAYVKATQGTNYIDPFYSTWAGNPGGLHEVPYHYCTTDDSRAQMAYLRDVVGNSVTECMLDEETGGARNIAELNAHVEAAHFEQFSAVDLYLPHWRWVEIGSPGLAKLRIRYLIASDYPTNAPGYASALYPGDNFPGWNEYGNKKPDILQFTSNAVVAGQHVDADAADSNVVWDTKPTPTPTPKPTNGVPVGWVATVKQVQAALNRWPFSKALAEDGDAGTLTHAAIVVFQHAAEIVSDGVPGPVTWSKLNLIYDATRPSVQQGSKGSVVKWVQQRLNQLHGFGLKEDGDFGPKTKNAVLTFQTESELAADGVVGRETNAALQL